MSDTEVKTTDSENEEQQNTNDQDDNQGGCLTVDDLQKQLNVGDFNKQMSNVISDATGFLKSYIQDQNNIKNNTHQRQRGLEEERLWQTALNKQRKLLDRHNRIIQMLEKEYNTTEQVAQSMENTKELYKMLEKENIKLKKIIEGEIHTIELLDRKTYYENEQNDWIGWWAHHFKTKYWLLIFLLIIGILLTNRQKERHLWVKVAGLAIYPYIVFFLIRLLVGLFNWIKSDTKWVYLYANM
jgi:hypothetical protein